MIQAFIKKGSFQDSVSLMLISRQLSGSEGVDEVSVMMGTPANKSMLDATGLWHDMFEQATPNDICVAIRCNEDNDAISALIAEQLDEALNSIAMNKSGGERLVTVRRWHTAQQKQPDANLALVSVAGEYAAEVAEQALDSDVNVMMFSDNVSVEQEVALKQKALQKGLIVMGPDCGTAMVNGSPLAFANNLPIGNIGIVGASGTGIQELVSQIGLLGQGVSHALGLGGRDLSEAVGGVSAITALEMLAKDPASEVIGFVSKPPAPQVAEKVIATMKALGKPVVALFLGQKHAEQRDGNVYFANSLAEAGRLSAMLAKVQQAAKASSVVPGQKILGLYTGGTLAAEAAMITAEQLGLEVDDAHHQGVMLHADGHQIIDLGDDHYTLGRPHPMIDPTTRTIEIESRAADLNVGVLLVDVVLGYGATQDPAGAVVEAVDKVRNQRGDCPLNVIATVTGTETDPQARSEQIDALLAANIRVMDNLEEAVLLAEQLISASAESQVQQMPALLEGLKVINIGLRSFAEDLQSTDTPVVHYQWSPIAGGNKKLASLLKQMQ
ncbi:acyl-CoA synthetase FdrA [Photobacterium sanctipauli]|uniref:Acyl-CoA synthetase FdrA n=1 Tax=Photobacterium sanctipauli TaxID=1342794 RepID=A0A2T3NU98_9GAMM|nr:acyl-CoA synthetase FdrA [Photobacterium sanctipauli]PSW19837.1 acyl-CoA synthetase FdrA [Photobacterium sanctipauli]